MPTWVFVRHGESRANHDGVFSGHGDTPLTDLGREQARAAAPTVAELRPRRAFSSDLARARDTASLLLHGATIPLAVTDQLRERDVGELTWARIAEVRDTPLGRSLETWRGRPPGGESIEDATLRGLTFLASIDDDADTLIVAHGTILRGVLAIVDALPADELGAHRLHNCEVVTRDLAVGEWTRLLTHTRSRDLAPNAKPT